MKPFLQLYHIIEDNSKIAFGLTFFFLIAYQLIPVFIGFEVCDSGFYMTFYDNIFTAPESVEYNFMYYLSGVTGGAFMALFPDAGIFDMRLLGVVNNMVTVYILYRLFKKHIPMSAIIIGTALVVISYIAMPMTLYNDLITCLLYVLAVFYLFKGLKQDKHLYFIVSGIIIGVNTFVRIPNVMDYGIVLLIILHTLYYKKGKFRICIKRCLIFTFSFIAGITGVIVFMKVAGHFEYFINNLHELTSQAKSDSEVNSHALSNLIFAQIRIYYQVFKFGIKVALLYSILTVSAKYIKKTILLLPIRIIIFSLLALLFYKENVVITLCAFSTIGLLGNIFLTKDKNLKMLSWAGLSMMLIIPLGSDGGMYNNGSVIYWLAMPMAISFYFSIEKPFTPTLPIQAIKQTLLLTLGVYILACGAKAINKGVYFDGGPLLEKRYLIRNDRVKQIYTSQKRAEIINELLVGIEPYINKGDYLFAYGSIPALNYMTRTKPFIGCSWPELLSASLLKYKLDNYTGPLPAILRQKFNSIGEDFGEPSENYLTDCGIENGHFNSNQKNRIVNNFIEKNHYKVAFENQYFVLFLPQ
ncbi:glycosyltransferase family 39 protein [Bacteroides sp.]